MKERPIIFSGPMVCAILEGRKTQTRRLAKPQPPPARVVEAVPGGIFVAETEGLHWQRRCPYGVPGDRLWVRETWAKAGEVGDAIEYRADNDDPLSAKWRPSIHMPRWASRIDLEVTGVRVERLQEISEDDAESEGVEIHWCTTLADGMPCTCGNVEQDLVDDFANLWESINNKRAPWSSNPWVWVVEFRRIRP